MALTRLCQMKSFWGRITGISGFYIWSSYFNLYNIRIVLCSLKQLVISQCSNTTMYQKVMVVGLAVLNNLGVFILGGLLRYDLLFSYLDFQFIISLLPVNGIEIFGRLVNEEIRKLRRSDSSNLCPTFILYFRYSFSSYLPS